MHILLPNCALRHSMYLLFACLTVTISNGELLAAQSSTMRIESVPSGARIERNGSTLGYTPFEMTYPKYYFRSGAMSWNKVLGERMIVTLLKDGFLPRSLELTHGPYPVVGFNGQQSGWAYTLEHLYSVHLTATRQVAPPSEANDAKWSSSGTAFHCFGRGYFATNHHVIAEASEIFVARQRVRCRAELVAQDRANDLAILKVDEPCLDTLDLGPPLRIETASTSTPGQKVVTYGYPLASEFGGEPQVSDGIIKSMSGLDNDARVVTISNSIQPGNSGGPLLSIDSGAVIGIVTAAMNVDYVYPRFNVIPQGLNFAVKSDYLSMLVQLNKNVPSGIETPGSKPHSPASINSPPENLEKLVSSLRSSVLRVEAYGHGTREVEEGSAEAKTP